MHVFNTIDQFYEFALHSLMTRGEDIKREGQLTKSLFAVCAGLLNIGCNVICAETRNFSPVRACAELLWCLDGSARIEMLAHYAPELTERADDAGNDWSAVGYRLANNFLSDECKCNQLELAVKCLREDSHAVIAIWRPSDLFNAVQKTRKRLPSTVSWQFFLREGRLHMHTEYRLIDIWNDLPYDLYVASSIQQLMAGELNARPGIHTAVFGDLFIQAKDYELAKDLVAKAHVTRPIQLPNPHKGSVTLSHEYRQSDFTDMDNALNAEKLSRKKQVEPGACRSPLISDAAAVCIAHNLNRDPLLHSPLLRKAYNDYYRRQRQSRKNDVVQSIYGD